MGYDTTAYRQPPWQDVPNEGNKIGYMCGRNGIFEALDVLEFDGQVSGNAGSRWFNRAELEKGLRRLELQEVDLHKEHGSVERGVVFLRECIASLSSDEDRLWIWFC